MAARRSRSTRAAVPDLTATLEDFAGRIGDRIGAGIARALASGSGQAAGRASRAGPSTCSREGCSRPVAAKGLCKSHYNLMLYHRRKAEASSGQAGKGRRRK